MPMSLPRNACQSRSDSPTSSRPRNRIEPVTAAVRGSRPMIACAETDLPHPDSPTTPSTSPARTSNETCRTACTTPSSVGKSTPRPLTLSSGSAPGAGAGSRAANTSSVMPPP